MTPLPPPESQPPAPGAPAETSRSLFAASLGLARGQVVVFFFFAAFLFLLHELYSVFSGFLAPIIWAAILAMLFFPLYTIVLRWCGGRETLAAFAFTLFITAGKKDKINKMDIVGMLLQKGKLAKDELGLVEVLDHSSYAAVTSNKIEKVVDLIRNEKIKNKKVRIEISK